MNHQVSSLKYDGPGAGLVRLNLLVALLAILPAMLEVLLMALSLDEMNQLQLARGR
jgi:hypothetical protein